MVDRDDKKERIINDAQTVRNLRRGLGEPSLSIMTTKSFKREIDKGDPAKSAQSSTPTKSEMNVERPKVGPSNTDTKKN